jgi:hypothetical protein
MSNVPMLRLAGLATLATLLLDPALAQEQSHAFSYGGFAAALRRGSPRATWRLTTSPRAS